MNTLAAANPFENPLVLAALAVVWVIANLLIKRRQRSKADSRPDSDDMQTAPDAKERPERLPDLQEVLGQLLGGEPSPQAPPPPTRVLRDGESSRRTSEEEQEGLWTGETSEAYEESLPSAQEAAERPRPETGLAQVSATRIEAIETSEEEARFARLVESIEPTPIVANCVRGRVARKAVRATSPWRNSQAARRAFVASLLFAPPKAFEKP